MESDLNCIKILVIAIVLVLVWMGAAPVVSELWSSVKKKRSAK